MSHLIFITKAFPKSTICKLLHSALWVLLPLLLFTASKAYSSEIYRYIDPQGRLVFTDKPKHSGYIRLHKTSRGWEVPSNAKYSWKKNRKRFTSTIDRMAEQHDVPPHLLHAIIMVESAYNPQAVSSAGAQGLMQLMPATADRFGVSDPYNPTQNIRAGATYIKWLLTLFEGDLSLALAGYNAGENAVKRYNNRIPPFKETQRYVKKVLGFYKKYRDKKYRVLANN
jgi:soluble lytic murein transglycosylase-like protein